MWVRLMRNAGWLPELLAPLGGLVYGVFQDHCIDIERKKYHLERVLWHRLTQALGGQEWTLPYFMEHWRMLFSLCICYL
jgi:hypothetical protein